MSIAKVKRSVTLVAAFVVIGLAGCQRADNERWQGYAEGEYVRLAAPFAGNLTQLHVKRGDRVAVNAPLFVLEQENERAARAEAASRVAQAESRLENLRKGRRPDEIAALRAQVAQAEASASLSAADLVRTEDLVKSKFLSPAKLDEARSAHLRNRSRVNETTAQLRVAQLAARGDEINAAAADVATAREQLAQAEWRLGQKSQRAPRAAIVIDTLYSAGEWVAAGMPVVSLLPPENIKVKFFVSEKQLGTIKLGQLITVTCDGCTAPIAASVSFIAPQAEYTSPLIYSKENRTTLVFLIEARAKPEDAVKLHPGQPVEVKLTSG
jgi:HlyD family secretion protein